MRARSFLSLFLLLCTFPTAAVTPRDAQSAARKYVDSHAKDVIGELVEFAAIPNVATDGPNIARNSEALVAMFARRGVKARVLGIDGAPPVVTGRVDSPGAKKTVGFYAHYDGQPADVRAWHSDPWRPVVRDSKGADIDWRAAARPDPEWRIYGRAVSDDKAPIVAMMAALDVLRANALQSKVNLLFLFEGEEEAGSPHLEEYLAKYPAELRADAWLLCDGPVHQTRRRQLYFGARGIAGLQLTVYGANRPLHSGHYGNWAPNPIVLLTHLIDSMRDVEGRILIPGFFDDVRPLTEAERIAVASAPPVDEPLRKELGLARTEGGGARLEEQILKPALNLRGISGGNTGALSANVISTSATASIDFRLVPDQTPEKVRQRVDEHLRKQGWFLVDSEPGPDLRLQHPLLARVEWEPGELPARTPMDSPFSRKVIGLLNAISDPPLVAMPSLGGTIPMRLFQGPDLLVPVIGHPIVNHDNNQHGADENLRLQNLWDGIEAFTVLFSGID